MEETNHNGATLTAVLHGSRAVETTQAWGQDDGHLCLADRRRNTRIIDKKKGRGETTQILIPARDVCAVHSPQHIDEVLHIFCLQEVKVLCKRRQFLLPQTRQNLSTRGRCHKNSQ